jgi:hypothetical protein
MPILLSIKRVQNKARSVLLTIVFILFPLACFSQKQVIKGTILDAKTYEAMPYVSVAAQDIAVGTISDIRGEFTLELPEKKAYNIYVSSVGYNSKTFIAYNDTNITILLDRLIFDVEEVIVTPDNSTDLLVKDVVKNKPNYSIDKSDAREYEMYTKAMIAFRKFNYKSDSSLNTRLFKKEFEKFSITSEDNNVPGLPGYMIESLSKVYELKSPQRIRRDVLSMNIKGTVFNQTEMLDELISKELDLVLYDNHIQLFDKAFVSPLANGADAFYNYYFTDTVEVEGCMCLEIHYTPKNKNDLCFSGSMWIIDSLKAPKRISARTSLKTDINYIDAITIHQNYTIIDSKSAPAELRIGITGLNLLIDVLSVKDNYILSEPKELGFYSEKFEPESSEEDNSELLEKREAYFSQYDRMALENLNDLTENKKIGTFSKLIELSITGYYKTRYVDIGPWLTLLSSNPIEGTRLRLGGNTTYELSSRFHVDGYFAYGFSDEQWKGVANTFFFLSRNRWALIGLRYGNDLANIGTTNPFRNGNAFFSLSNSISSALFVNRVRLRSVYSQMDIFQNVTFKTEFLQADYYPTGENFIFSWQPVGSTDLATNFSNTEFQATLSYHPGNNFIVDGNRRFLAGNTSSPYFRLSYSKAFKNLLNGDFDYQKLQISLEQKVFTGGFGYLHYLTTYEQTFGQTVYPLLNILPGNETIWRSWTQFNLIDKGMVVADRLFVARAEWHFDGSITRRVPLIKLLDVRLLAGGNIAFGSFNSGLNGYYHNTTNATGILSSFDANGETTSTFKTLKSSEPYSEAFFGVENILKVLRIDFIYRLNPYYDNYASYFGAKISGSFGM